jgi:hypothetical protein
MNTDERVLNSGSSVSTSFECDSVTMTAPLPLS